MTTRTDLAVLLEQVARGEPLTAQQAESAFDRFMDGSATEIQIDGLLMALRTRGVTREAPGGALRPLR
mgnify:CR=1 FL=1